MEEVSYSIQELCDRTGLTRRTIHFYIQQGLLPPAVGSGLGASYLPDHLLRLELIPILRKQGMRLDQIRDRFQTHSLSELNEMRSTLSKPKQPAVVVEGGQSCTWLNLSGGIVLIIPETMSSADQLKVKELLAAAARIYGQQSDSSIPSFRRANDKQNPNR